MFFHVGTHLYGKVDQVPGLLHVGTQFFHLNFVPLVPMGSYLVLHGVSNSDETPGMPIPWSRKSVFFGWGRAALWIGATSLLVSAAVEAIRCLENQGDWVEAGGMALGAIVMFVLLPISYRLTHASPLRALELAKIAGIEPEVVAKYFVYHSSLASPEELDRQGA
jgi:hypothetical protein